MGIGLFDDRLSHPLTRADYRTGATLAAWIEKDMPCVTGAVPSRYMEQLGDDLLGAGVPSPTVTDALHVLEDKGIVFEYPVRWPLQYAVIHAPKFHDPNNPGDREPQQYHGLTKAEALHMQVAGVKIYEAKFQRALLNHDPALAAQIIAAVINLLVATAKFYAAARQQKEKLRQQLEDMEQWNEAIEKTLEGAPGLEDHIRHMTKQELNELRSADGPVELDRITFRISTRLGHEAVEDAEERESETEAE